MKANNPPPKEWVKKFNQVIDLLNQAMIAEKNRLEKLEKQPKKDY